MGGSFNGLCHLILYFIRPNETGLNAVFLVHKTTVNIGTYLYTCSTKHLTE